MRRLRSGNDPFRAAEEHRCLECRALLDGGRLDQSLVEQHAHQWRRAVVSQAAGVDPGLGHDTRARAGVGAVIGRQHLAVEVDEGTHRDVGRAGDRDVIDAFGDQGDGLARVGVGLSEAHKGAGRDELARLDAAVLAAEAELSALYETASDLTAIRDVDTILAAIVRRARQLLHCDMTYLSLNDEDDGASFMKVTDGALTREFQNLRLPLGTGLLGLVAQTGAAYFKSGFPTNGTTTCFPLPITEVDNNPNLRGT